MIKIFKEDIPENNKKDFLLARRLGEIILYLVAAIQLFQEFSDSMYFIQLLIILTMTGAYIFVFGSVKKYCYMVDKYNDDFLTGHKEMMDFHSNFIASLFIPMVFLFNTDNGVFSGTSLWDLKTMKLIILAVSFVSLVYYRFLVFLAGKYIEKTKSDKEYEESDRGINHYNVLVDMLWVGLIIDGILVLLNFWLVSSMEWNNFYFSDVTLDVAMCLMLCVIILFWINDKKRIILCIMIVITVLDISYNSYMQFSEVKTYSFGVSDYNHFYKVDGEEKRYLDINCRFETDENNKGIYKCYMILFADVEGGLDIIEEAVAYGNYEAIRYKNSFFEWQDREKDVFIEKKKLDAGEIPVKFKIINEVVECKEDSFLKKYIDNDRHLNENDNKETEILIIGKDYINFRGNKLEKIEEADEFIDGVFDGIKI